MVLINRQVIPRLPVFKDPNDALVYQDAFSLSPIHSARVVPTKKKNFVFSAGRIDVLKALSPNEAITQFALATCSQTSEPYLDIEFDHKISDVLVQIPFLYGGKVCQRVFTFWFLFESTLNTPCIKAFRTRLS